MTLAVRQTKLLLLGLMLFAPAAFATSNITTAANGDGIPYPTATNTYVVTDNGQTIQVPVNMVYVPAGAFTYNTGTNATNIVLSGYCIGKFDVCNAEYKAFLDATGYSSVPSYWTNRTYPTGKANHPVLYVSLTNALAYCAWVSTNTGWNVTIPTAPQWEKAARGTNAFLYPWGNTAGATYSNGVVNTKFNFNAVCAAYYLNNYSNAPAVYDNSNSPYYGTTTTVSRIAAYDTNGVPTYLSVTASAAVNGWVNHDTWTGFIYTDVFDALNAVGGNTTAIGSYTNGISGYGCYDMAGNVWDWTATLFIASNGAEAGQLVNEVRGGSWYATGSSCKSIDTGEGRSAAGNYNTVGFRLALLPASLTDSVGDGIPDSWRAQYFGSPGTNTNFVSCATCDPDHDGFNNLAEYLAGTDPTNATSRFAIIAITKSNTNIQVTWTGGTAAWQYLEYSSTLTTNQWTGIFTNTPPTASTNSVIHTGATTATNLFYRIKAHR